MGSRPNGSTLGWRTTEVAPPPVTVPTPISENPHARMDRLEQRMPKIKRYTGIGCPRIHLRLYSTIMRAHGLDETQMVMFFPMSLSGVTQRWHLMGFPHTDFGYLVKALYGIEEGIARGLWSESFPTDSKGKKPLGGQRSRDVGVISSTSQMTHRHHKPAYLPPTLALPYYVAQGTMKPLVSYSGTVQPCYVAQFAAKPTTFYPRHRAQQTYASFALKTWDESEPEPIVVDKSYEIGGVTLVLRMPTPFRLVLEAALIQTAIVEPLTFPYYSVQMPFLLITNVEEVQTPYVDDVHTPDSTQARISIWILMAFSNTHRDALIRALSQIRVEITTTPERLIHMVTLGKATCIVFSNDDLPPEGSDHTFLFVILDNGSAPNVYLLAIAIVLGYALSEFGSSTHTVQAYDSTRREVMGTLEIELLIGPTTFITLFQVLRIPTSFNLLLGRPWIHRARTIPSSLHQKVKFIHGGQVVTMQFVEDMFISSEPVLQINHNDDDLFLTRFTFDEVQTLEMEDFAETSWLCRLTNMVAQCEFMAILDHDVPFGLGFIPIEADYRYMVRLRKERVRPQLTHTSFDYLILPYTTSLADYFVRASELQTYSEEIIGGLNTVQEAEL
ncbi:hypothetical protein AAG906_016108 [Vitis piasezkii]